MTFAALRPDAWNLPLLLHVFGAMVFVGVLAALAVILVVALRSDDRAAALALAARTLMLGALPAYVLMRGTAEWVASEEDVPDDATWVGIGYIVTDAGFLILVALGVLVGLATRRARRDRESRGLVRPATVLTLLLIAAYAVALWAMTAKPV
jgi:uncharacterized membrane protein YkvI